MLAVAALAFALAASPAATPTAAEGALRMIALGDSYTIGESVADRDRWPVQLIASLRARGIDAPDPEIIARTGWSTRELLAAIDRKRPRGPYALVGVLIGVNDQFRGGVPEVYRNDLRRVLTKAVELAGGRAAHVVVLSIPDWGATPFAEGRDRALIAKDIDAFNRVAREEAERYGARWIDITDISRRAQADGSLIAADGLHPSAKMYAAWVERLRPVVAR